MTAEAFLTKLTRVRRTRLGWMAQCPAHRDRTPSLAISVGVGGRLLIYDYAGCRPAEVVRALGLTLGDLFAEPSIGSPRPRPPRSPMAEARREVLTAARREPWTRELVQLRYFAADAL